jgi:hypothetical protein
MPDTSTEVAIATTTLSSAASTITFSSIGAGYTDLRLVVIGSMASGTGYWAFRLNADSGTNYSVTFLSGSGSAATSSRLTSNNAGFINFANTIGTSITTGTLDIFNYAGSTNKTALATFSGDENGSGYVERGVNLWRNTSAITSLTLRTDTANNFAIGTTATLYGIL